METIDVEVASERTALLSSAIPAIDQTGEKKETFSLTSVRFWLLVLSYASILFLMAANATALTTTYGVIGESLHAYSTAATWFNASYMIASSCTNPLIGRLATIFRPTNLFLACTTAFTIGCLITGLAQNSTTFMVGRVFTGCGAGGLFTTATVLLVEAAPTEKRGLLIGLINSVITCGSCLGGVMSGAFAASRFGWRPTFIIQAPLTLVASIYIFFVSPSPPARHENLSLLQKFAKIDYLGMLSLSVSLILLLLGAMAPVFSPTPIFLGLAALVVFVIVEAFIATLPMIPVQVLLHPPTLFGCLAAMCTMTARWALLFYAPIWSIAVLGYHPARAGASLIPASVGFAIGGVVVGAFSVRHGGGYYWQSLVSIALLASTYLIFNSLILPITMTVYLFLLVGNGLATGGVLNYTLAHVLSATSEKAIVAGLYSTFRGLAPSAGAGLAGGILQRELDSSLVWLIRERRREEGLTQADKKLVQRLKGSPTLVWQLTGWKRSVGIMAYEQAIKSVFWMAFGCAVIALVLQALTSLGKERNKPETTVEPEAHLQED